jgi:3-oxoacyl-[acyl-carrier protein] reductase
MEHSLQGKAALITGGSRGIGRAVAIGLAAHGARVVIGYHSNATRASEVVASIVGTGGKATAIQANLARPSEVTRLFDEAERVIGLPDIVVSSTGGTKMFFPGQSLYLGSKGAVEQFARALSWELGARGITVNVVSPGPTETDMMQERYRDKAAALSPFNRIGDPRDIADIVAFLVSGNARGITGQNIGAGGGAF